MKFFEICAEVLVPKFTRAEVRLPVYILEFSWLKIFTYNYYVAKILQKQAVDCNY